MQPGSIEQRAEELAAEGQRNADFRDNASRIAKGGASQLNAPGFGTLEGSQRLRDERSQLNDQMHLNRKKERAIRIGYRHALKRGDGARAMKLLEMGEDAGINPFGIKQEGERASIAKSQLDQKQLAIERGNPNHIDKVGLKDDIMGRIKKEDPEDPEFQRAEMAKLLDEIRYADSEERSTVPRESSDQVDVPQFGTFLTQQQKADFRKRMFSLAPGVRGASEEQLADYHEGLRLLDVDKKRGMAILGEGAAQSLASQESFKIKTALSRNPDMITANQRRVLLNTVLGTSK